MLHRAESLIHGKYSEWSKEWWTVSKFSSSPNSRHHYEVQKCGIEDSGQSVAEWPERSAQD